MSALASIDTTATDTGAGRWMANAMAVMGAAVCAISVAFVAQAVPADQAVSRGSLQLLVVGVPIAAGLYALRVPSHARFGFLLVGAGLAWSVTALAESPESLPYSIGRVAAWMIFPSLIYLLLAFPAGRVADGLDRGLYRSLNAVLWLLYVGSALIVEQYPQHTPWALCDSDCPPNAFLVLRHEPAIMGSFVQPVREALATALFAAVLVSIMRRWRGATPLRRRTMLPVLLAGGASTPLLGAFFVARRIDPDSSLVTTLGVLWSLCVAAMAAAFLLGLLRRRLLVGHVLAQLAERLSNCADLARLRDALAGALRDPTLEVLVPDGPVHWRDSRGRTGELIAHGDRRDVAFVRDDGVPAAAILHDRDLRNDEDLLHAVSALVLGTVRHQAATNRLAGALDQLGQSRQRIAEAADHERARIERDLHDGAQQRLMMLRIRLSLAEDLLKTNQEAGTAALRDLGVEIDRTLDELRSLAHGVYPAILNDRGLEDALRSLAIDVPLPVHLQTRGITRHSTQLETAIYFTCAEAVQNAVKHAPRASGVWVELRQTDALRLEVRDDGPGFTPPVNGSIARHHDGLRNMRDRLEAVGGRLTIDAAPGHGTRIICVVPLV